MDFIKSLLYPISTGIALALLAIAPGMAVAIVPNVATLNRLHESETSPHPPTSSANVGRNGAYLKVPLPTLGEGFRVRVGFRGGGLLVEDTKLAQSSPPPPRKNPGGSSAGGRRDPTACPQDGEAAPTHPGLTALAPTTKPGITLAERPTFLVYIPKTSAKTAEFSLRDRTGRGVYRTTFALTSTPGIVSLNLPAQAPALEVGKQYLWSLAVICNPNDRVNDRFVMGTVQRTELDATRLRQIQQASPKEQVALYQKVDAWYDVIAVLFELQRTQPNDSTISVMWREFLQSGGVEMMVDSK